MSNEDGLFRARPHVDEVPPDERCTRCGAAIARMAYGFPGPGMREAEERGEIALGGCVVFDGQATHACTECGATFGSRRFTIPDDLLN